MVKFTGLYVSLLFIIFASYIEVSFTERSFVINYEKDSFYMDGKPFRYVSGSVHYFRIPQEYWRDRLRKVRAAGLNAISTYVEWSQHEPTKGVYNFTGDLNIKKFIKIAQEEDLYVILRPGPYICAERDFGGLPYWLLKYKDIELRSNDENYKKNVQLWTDVLMKKLSSLLYGNGGPIIMVQVENEYGSYFACDYNYTVWLRDLFKKHVKNNAVLFTTDGAVTGFLKCGKIPDVYATVDFGWSSNVDKAFEAQRKYEPKGPLVNSEFYPGWLTHWGEKMQKVETNEIVKTLTEMLDKGANVNFYMFHGGTNFGFTSGANMENKGYTSDITSYDYDAPITEAGDLTPKYNAIRDVVFKYLPPNNISVNSSQKGKPDEITLPKVATFLSRRVREEMGKVYKSENPKSFEDLDFSSGYVLYETFIPQNFSKTDDGKLVIKEIKDLATVYRNGQYLGNMSRESKSNALEVKNINDGGKLSVLVENLGRINFGSYLHDKKGILSPVALRYKILKNWNMTTFDFKNLEVIERCADNPRQQLNTDNDCDNGQGFAFYLAKYILDKNEQSDYELDIFFDVSELTKGLIFLNGFNLGRYWSTRGPQYTLYVPGVYLKSHPNPNIIIIMDENIQSNSIKLKITNKPKFRY